MNTCEQKILLVIPVFDEGKRIGRILQDIKQIIPSISVLIVDDCSNDTSKEQAKRVNANVLSHPINLGYGSSLETGYLYAIKNNFDIVVQMDGDGQHLPEEIHKILEPVLKQEADLTIGSRYLTVNKSYKTSLARRLGQVLFSAIFSILTKTKITDPTSGFQCLNRKCFQLLTKSNFPHDFPDVDVLLMVHYAGFRIKEVPVFMKERSGGKSIHIGLKPLYYIIKMFFSIFLVILNFRRWR